MSKDRQFIPKVIGAYKAMEPKQLQTPARANIELYSSMCKFLGNTWQDVNAKWLSWLYSYGTFSGHSSHGFSLGPTLLLPCNSLQMTHVLGFSKPSEVSTAPLFSLSQLYTLPAHRHTVWPPRPS